MPKKVYQDVTKKITLFGLWIEASEFDGPLDDIVDMILWIKVICEKDGYHTVKFIDDTGYDSSTDWILEGTRKETDNEWEVRLAKSLRLKKTRKDLKDQDRRERKNQYERLKAEFG